MAVCSRDKERPKCLFLWLSRCFPKWEDIIKETVQLTPVYSVYKYTVFQDPKQNLLDVCRKKIWLETEQKHHWAEMILQTF